MERTGGDGRRHVADAVNDYAAQAETADLFQRYARWKVNPIVHSTRGLLGYSRVPYHANAAEPGDGGTAAPPAEQADGTAVFDRLAADAARKGGDGLRRTVSTKHGLSAGATRRGGQVRAATLRVLAFSSPPPLVNCICIRCARGARRRSC